MIETLNRVTRAIDEVRPRIEALDEAKRENLDRTLDLEFGEHFAYQTAQARAHAEGKLTLDEAQIVYRALGESGGGSNGGWPVSVDLATKVVVTQLMGELLAARQS